MERCAHEAAERFRICRHLHADVDGDLDSIERFTGRGSESELLCYACRQGPSELVEVCATCRDVTSTPDDIEGTPTIIDEPAPLSFAQRRVVLHTQPLLDIQPIVGPDRDCWIALAAGNELLHVDLDHGVTTPLAVVPEDVTQVRVSRDGRLVVVFNPAGLNAVVMDLESRRVTMTLARDGNFLEHCEFPLAFFERGGRQLLVWSPETIRLDIADARSGELLTARPTPAYNEPHYSHYYHSALSVSPRQDYIADNGWVDGAPAGIVFAWSLDRWLDENVWESEDGASKQRLCQRFYFWNGPLCWLDDTRLAVWGYGYDEQKLLDGIRIFDVRSGTEERPVLGPPRGTLVFDRVLLSASRSGASVWNVERRSRLHVDDSMHGTHYHPTAKTFVEIADGALVTSVLRGLDPADGVIRELARRIGADHDFRDGLPVLGDALLAAGCTDHDMLTHCRHPGEHAGRCWVIERLGCA